MDITGKRWASLTISLLFSKLSLTQQMEPSMMCNPGWAVAAGSSSVISIQETQRDEFSQSAMNKYHDDVWMKEENKSIKQLVIENWNLTNSIVFYLSLKTMDRARASYMMVIPLFISCVKWVIPLMPMLCVWLGDVKLACSIILICKPSSQPLKEVIGKKMKAIF